LKEARTILKFFEPPEWRDLRAVALELLLPYLLAQPPTVWPEPSNISAAIMALTGFTILCDWIGSDATHFKCQCGESLEQYVPESELRARRAADADGFFAVCQSAAPLAFVDLFPDKVPPRSLQTAVDAVPTEALLGPCLAILEAPTGEGKTEAALALAHRIAQARGSDELYYALPTMATSNQMFVRLQTHLYERLGLETQVKLVHGQAFLVEDDLRIAPMEDAGKAHSQAAQDWFGAKKRSLLAAFGVGTIDQVELAVLNVRHTALRMIGLAGKVVILDEVHAYDIYMTTILEALLGWLRALDTSVIILSATMPLLRRAALARAYGVDASAMVSVLDYPSLWILGEGGSYYSASQEISSRPMPPIALGALHWGDDQESTEAKARWLLDAVAKGGCVCWMTNLVRRAQSMFDALDHLAGPDVDRMLLHAQMPLMERQNREKELVGKYGPGCENRPERGVVVGTQVLEQSLDLDFDVLVSDLAPIDLLLQRAGRLHRHVRSRPAEHTFPRLWINVPLSEANELCLEPDCRVYAAFMLSQTWDTLHYRTEIVLPRDYRPLVEMVYGFTDLPPGHPFQSEWRDLKKQEANATAQARLRLLPDADPRWAFSSRMARLQFEENENSAAWIVAQTRLGEESVTVLPLERRGNTAWCWGNGPQVRLDRPAPREVQLALLRSQMRISDRRAVPLLKAQPLPVLFAESALLRGYLPLWLEGGKCGFPLKGGTLELELNEKLGLRIHKKGV
jgi:CRISPR-associated endonuclease/helicase Cas3